MSENEPSMDMEVTETSEAQHSTLGDIPAMKEAAKEVMENISSEVIGKNGDTMVNGTNIVQNGSTENGNDEDMLSHSQVDDTKEVINQNGDASSHEVNAEDEATDTVEPIEIDKNGENNTEVGDNVSEKVTKDEAVKLGDDKDAKKGSEGSTATQSTKPSPKKRKEKEPIREEDIRRSGRKKTPTKYHELLINEMALEAMEDASEEEIEDVEEVKDDDSDIQEVDENGSVSISSKGCKKPNVVTIDDLKTLQRLATSAKQSMDKAKSDNLMVIDTQSIIAGKMGSGVSITPAKPKPTSSLSISNSLNITPAGLTLGSGVTIKPNRPGTGVSVTPVSSKSQELNDPNLTDETFVVEAPSFIVPYVYEKPPLESIRDFKESIEKEIVERKKAKDKKKEDGEEVSDDEEPPPEKPKRVPDKEHKDPFFSSTLGRFFSDLGMNLVQEYVQKDLLRQQQKRSVRDKSAAVMHAIKSLQQNLDDTRENVMDFKFELKKCKFCSFRTESRLVMQHHMETPHMRNFVYRCNFCEFETKIPQEVLYHMDSEHGVKGKLERAPYFHQCPQCPFEDNGKGKLTRHKMGCDKRFMERQNQVPDRDWDPPAKIRPPPVRPTFTGYMQKPLTMGGGSPSPHGSVIHRPGSSLLPKGAVVGQAFQQQQQQQQHQNKFVNRSGLPNQSNRGRPVGSYKGQADLRIPQPQMSQQQQQQQYRMRGMSPQMLASQQMLAVLNQQGLSVSGSSKGNNGSVTIQSLGQKTGNKGNSPSISITPLLGRGGSNSGAKGGSPSPTVKPGQPGAGQGGGKGNFVICEICDGYIKDLEQLRNHMQWIHKVKIHPKMIYNRPPLNCQKCQFRFFTDQGLERHLLGSHGLVTASMQDAANKGQDSGRCPVCGKVYQWKLLNHVAKDHGKTLKPAHLSYKCTVCTATFGQYKLFENHVYTAHSGVAKKGDKGKQVSGKGPSSVLKAPVKLSDEISIIPSKKSGDKKNEVIDLDDEEEIEDVEKEVINLDSTPKKQGKKVEPSKRTAEESDEPECKRVKNDSESSKD